MDRIRQILRECLNEEFKSSRAKKAVKDFGGVRNGHVGERRPLPVSDMEDDDFEDRVYKKGDEDYKENDPNALVFNNGNYIRVKSSARDKYKSWGDNRNKTSQDFEDDKWAKNRRISKRK